MTLEERLTAAREKRPKGFVWDYIIPKDGNATDPETVLCKMTGATIQSTRKAGSRMMLLPTSAYSEICIDFNDGSHHITAMSRDGVKHLTPEDLEVIYCADLAQWQKETETINDEWAARVPVSYSIEEDK
jgi:hypothetical protein